jgi:hypothetical protein
MHGRLEGRDQLVFEPQRLQTLAQIGVGDRGGQRRSPGRQRSQTVLQFGHLVFQLRLPVDPGRRGGGQ